MEYFSIADIKTCEITEKSSKFIAYAYPVNQLEEIKQIFENLKKNHPKSRHVCCAYRLGFDQNVFRTVDDGEPSGTAGKPILGQIDKLHLTNIAIFVVRYFGGILLGTGGLIKAYKTASQMCLESCAIIEINRLSNFKITCGFAQAQSFLNQLKLFHGKLLEMNTDSLGNELLIEISSKTAAEYFKQIKSILDKNSADIDVYNIFGCEIIRLD